MPNTDETPFLIDNQPVGRIHHDAGGVPYLCIHDEQGNAWRIYGYAQVQCADGGGGEWLPGNASMRKVIHAWQKRREIVRRARAEIQKI